MEDCKIVQDEYFYIKERAFKHIREIQKSNISKPVLERASNKGKHNQNKLISNASQRKNKVNKQTDSRKIDCPIHSCKLITVYLDTILIDYCPECYGIWLDFGELENLLNKKIEKNKLFKDKLTGPLRPSENKKEIKNCPLCNKGLDIKKYYNSNIYLDICSICGGIWFDSGEFAVLYLNNKKDSSIQDILAGVVGNYIDITI